MVFQLLECLGSTVTDASSDADRHWPHMKTLEYVKRVLWRLIYFLNTNDLTVVDFKALIDAYVSVLQTFPSSLVITNSLSMSDVGLVDTKSAHVNNLLGMILHRHYRHWRSCWLSYWLIDRVAAAGGEVDIVSLLSRKYGKGRRKAEE
jgi:hypothetical protein